MPVDECAYGFLKKCLLVGEGEVHVVLFPLIQCNDLTDSDTFAQTTRAHDNRILHDLPELPFRPTV